jgi:hypothetical protein
LTKAAPSFLKAQGALLTARAALEHARLDLEFCRSLRQSMATRVSPISPWATWFLLRLKKPLTTIVSMNPVYAYADVDERSLLRYVRYYYAFKKVLPGDETK